MYSFILLLHSIIRWLALILLIAAFFKAWMGVFSGEKWSTRDRKLGIGVIASLHTQLLLGLLLYIGLSPVTSAAFKNMGAAMKDPTLRFWAVEHIFIAVIGIAASQVGFTLAKRAQDDRSSFMRAAAGYTLGLLCICAAIPWPFRAAIARPLLPF